MLKPILAILTIIALIFIVTAISLDPQDDSDYLD